MSGKTAETQPRAMRIIHGCVPACAVCSSRLRCYYGAMKPQPHRNADTHRDTGRPSPETCSVSEREVDATGLHRPPLIPHRRYPSLSDDGQPYFPRLRRKRRTMEKSMTVARPSVESDEPVFLSVRVISLLAIVVIIAVLVAAA